MADAIKHDQEVQAKFRAVFKACEAAFEREIRAGGQRVLDYQHAHGLMGMIATRTTTGWRADITATVSQIGRVSATCFTDEGYRVLDLQR